MELRQYLTIIRRWWWLLLLGAVLGAAAGYLAGAIQPLRYQTKTTLAVGRFTQSANPSSAEITAGQYLARNYATMAQREPVLQATVDQLGLAVTWSQLREQVSAKTVLDAPLIEITVTDTDPYQVKLIADTVAQQVVQQSPSLADPEEEAHRLFIKQQLAKLETDITEGNRLIQELQAALELETTAGGITRRQEDIDALQNKLAIWQSNYAALLGFLQNSETGVNYLSIIEPAIVPTSPTARLEQTLLLAALVGLMLAAGVVFLLEYLDDTIKTTAHVQQALNLVPLGTIPTLQPARARQNGRGQLVPVYEAFSPVAEAYRAVRTNIQFSSLVLTHPAATLLVTSAGPGEGKSTTAANLAVVMAQSGKQVILVDADLRRPSLHKLFGLSNETGLTSLLLEQKSGLVETLLKTPVGNLRLLPSGPLPPNAADVLAAPQMEGLLAQLTEQADLVIFDSPPLLLVTDASILATRLKSVIMVVEAGKTRREVCLRGLEALEYIGVRPMGVVLNKFNPRRDAGYGYGYGYGYYHSSENGRTQPSQSQIPKPNPVNHKR